jgi:hypothetical protein
MKFRRTVFSQVMDFLSIDNFRACVSRYHGDYKVKSFSCWDQFLCLSFAQLTFRESLRDIEVCLRSQESKLYHLGFRGKISRSTLADANENRDWRIFSDLAQVLIQKAKKLYVNDKFRVDLEDSVYALDSTTIDLCLSIFPWAKFRKTKGAIKLHTLLDLRGDIPEFIHISDGKLHDVNVLDILVPKPGSFYIMDRGYVDFKRLYSLKERLAFFVTRAKRGFQFKRQYSYPIDKNTGLRFDQRVILSGQSTSKDYPEPLRRIGYFDQDTKKFFIFITNNFVVPAQVICDLYKMRWKVELFFKWIKQHLKIKTFFGTSENAVKTQIWIAVCTYVIVAIMKKELHLKESLYTILQILSVTVFEKNHILQVLADDQYKEKNTDICNQLELFNL